MNQTNIWPAFMFLLCWYGIVWSLVRSNKRKNTLLLMAVSYFLGWIIVYALVSASHPNNIMNAPATAALYTVPSFIVPAIVGVIHARRNKKVVEIPKSN